MNSKSELSPNNSSFPGISYDEISNKITIRGSFPVSKKYQELATKSIYPVNPIDKICLAVKKSFQKETGACVAYMINATTNFDGETITIISFLFSNTGDQKIEYKSHAKVRQHSKDFETRMAKLCHQALETYLSENTKAPL